MHLEEDKSSYLSLKNEFDALYLMLSLHSTNVENILKQQNFFKRIFVSVENPRPDNLEFWSNGICFSVRRDVLTSGAL